MPSQLLLRSACRRLTASVNNATTTGVSASNILKKAAIASSSSSRIFSTQPATDEDPIHESESFLSGTSSVYAESMYELYQQDPNSVHKSWKQYFDNIESGIAYEESQYDKPTGAKPTSKAAIAAMSGVREVLALLYCLCACVFVYVLHILGLPFFSALYSPNNRMLYHLIH